MTGVLPRSKEPMEKLAVTGVQSPAAWRDPVPTAQAAPPSQSLSTAFLRLSFLESSENRGAALP